MKPRKRIYVVACSDGLDSGSFVSTRREADEVRREQDSGDPHCAPHRVLTYELVGLPVKPKRAHPPGSGR